MCGIVGAIGKKDAVSFLMAALQRLEYRGYDSAGIAVLDADHVIQRLRRVGKVHELQEALKQHPLSGQVGIAHTRWATHGKPSELNAHPHTSGKDVAIVHNGIIENYQSLRTSLEAAGYTFTSETDTEAVAHLLHQNLTRYDNFFEAAMALMKTLEGSFAIVLMYSGDPSALIALRCGSPLVIGIGDKEHFIASDTLSLLPVTQEFIFLEEGDIAYITRDKIEIHNEQNGVVKRQSQHLTFKSTAIDRGNYRHYMEKEIFEQPLVIENTLEGRLGKSKILEESFGPQATQIFDQVQHVQVVACGTSYHAGLVSRYWLEGLAGIPCQVEVASEMRYRQQVVQPNTLFVAVSQSGETADTLAALRIAKEKGYLATLAICNVPESSLTREADLNFMTRAGVEIGVASTKAFTTQLVSLLLLTGVLGRRHQMTSAQEERVVVLLKGLIRQLEHALKLDPLIQQFAKHFANKQNALFLGRGIQYPIALEGALKLKEISYIHAEGYPSGELKHGPLALVDKNMPVVAVAPQDALLEKLQSNLEEVHARGGELFVFADENISLKQETNTHFILMPSADPIIAPLIYTIPLQLLAYHVAALKGTDVDQPRNLAKSVTVE
jgi:glucosamine--fructose-6-phosphate aminotransferase (isomerizing)